MDCILDVVSQDPELSTQINMENLATLQRKVKCGVSNLHEAAICEEIIDDRMIAKDIVALIGTAELQM